MYGVYSRVFCEDVWLVLILLSLPPFLDLDLLCTGQWSNTDENANYDMHMETSPRKRPWATHWHHKQRQGGSASCGCRKVCKHALVRFQFYGICINFYALRLCILRTSFTLRYKLDDYSYSGNEKWLRALVSPLLRLANLERNVQMHPLVTSRWIYLYGRAISWGHSDPSTFISFNIQTRDLQNVKVHFHSDSRMTDPSARLDWILETRPTFRRTSWTVSMSSLTFPQ